MAFKVTIGQYYQVDSLIHRLDPRVKLVIVILFAISAFFSYGVATNVVMGLAILICTKLARIPLKMLINSIAPIAVFLVFTAIANLFLVHMGNTVFEAGIIRITDQGIQSAIFLSIRFVWLMMAGSLLSLTTSPVELTDGAERLTAPLARFGFPSHELAMILSIALRFVPTLTTEAQHVIRAQTARGASLSDGSFIKRLKNFVPILIPLFASAIRHATNLATAMEARCYTGGEGRTHFHELAVTKLDYVAIGCFMGYIIIFAVARLMLPTLL